MSSINTQKKVFKVIKEARPYTLFTATILTKLTNLNDKTIRSYLSKAEKMGYLLQNYDRYGAIIEHERLSDYLVIRQLNNTKVYIKREAQV